MVSNEEKRRRATLVQTKVGEETEEEVSKMPISFEHLGALFDHLDIQLGTKRCDHTQIITSAFLRDNSLNLDEIVPWLAEHGGHCDCEVLANVEECWGDLIAKNT